MNDKNPLGGGSLTESKSLDSILSEIATETQSNQVDFSSVPKWNPFSRAPNASAVAAGIRDIPDHWSLTPLQDKRPSRDNWQSEPFIPHSAIADLILKGERKTSKKSGRDYTTFYSGAGLRTGEQSGGLIALDVDGFSAEPLLQRISGGDIPSTVAWTSGRSGRRQILFQVPEAIRSQIADFGRSVVVEFEDLTATSGEMLEFRYSNHQSCLPPSRHPQTGSYKWIHSPADTEVAIAPQWLCDLLVKFANHERNESDRKQQRAAGRNQSAEERRRHRQQNSTVGATNLEDVLEESLKRLTVEDIYNWSGHNWHYQGDQLKGCCPRHQSNSGTSFQVNTETKEWYCFACRVGGGAVNYRYFAQGGNGTPRGKNFIEVLRRLATDAGVELPQLQKREVNPTFKVDECEHESDLPNWFRRQLKRVAQTFKGFGQPKISTPLTLTAPVIAYKPRSLPTPEEHKRMGSPLIRFKDGDRRQVIAELISRGHHDILDSSAAGSGKSYDAGVVEPAKFGVDRLWYFSQDHRNPTTAAVEGNYTDLPVRNSGLFEDVNRSRTGLNNTHVRWPKEGETPNIEGNCFRAPIFHALSSKGYSTEVEVGDGVKMDAVCGTCSLVLSCTGKGERQPRSGFRSDRREVFATSDRIRASLASAPSPKDLEAKAALNGVRNQPTNRNGAFVDEAMRHIQSTEVVEVSMADFYAKFGEMETQLPDEHEALKHLRSGLRPILAGEIPATSETRYGWNDSSIRAALAGAADILDIPKIIDALESNKPDLVEILREPNSDIEAELRSLPCNWLIPFLEVLGGYKRGALRINNGVLTITTRDNRHADALAAMQWAIYLDATATREYLALSLGIDPSDIVEIQQEPARVENLTIVQVTGLGLVGKGRSDALKERVATLKTELKNRHPDIAFLDHKPHAQDGGADGHWFVHNRGSNEFKNRSAIASFGTPYENIGSLQDQWLTLTGDCNLDKNAPAFSGFVAWKAQSEFVQAVGRLRSNRRPDEHLTYYVCCNFDLIFLGDYYPGATLKQESSFSVVPESGTSTEQSHWRVQKSIVEHVRQTGAALQKLTQVAVAKITGLTHGRISQIAAKYGGWMAYKKLLACLLESPYSGANNLSTLDSEQQFLAETYLPLAAEDDPLAAVEAVFIALKAYGAKVFESILAATSPETRSRLLAALICGLPPELIGEFRVFAGGAHV